MTTGTKNAALDALLFAHKTQARIGYTPAHRAALAVLRTPPLNKTTESEAALTLPPD